MRFKPTNPIPPLGAIKIVYPKSVIDVDDNLWSKTCSVLTDLSYGLGYCHRDTKTRTVWFLGVFANQARWTAQITVTLIFKNPKTNVQPTLTPYEQSFHIETYDFNLREL